MKEPEDRATETIRIYLTAAEKKEVFAIAEKAEVSVSNYIRTVLKKIIYSR